MLTTNSSINELQEMIDTVIKMLNGDLRFTHFETKITVGEKKIGYILL